MAEKIKTKDFQCWKDIGGEGEMVSCDYSKKSSSVHIHPSSIILQKVDCKKYGQSGTQKCQLTGLKKFTPGDMWSDDFNYCGMLEVGKESKVSDGIKKLRKLFDSYEDVNYHEQSVPLSESINFLENGNKDMAENKIKEFNKLSVETIKEIC